jgi:hypothetical protein
MTWPLAIVIGGLASLFVAVSSAAADLPDTPKVTQATDQSFCAAFLRSDVEARALAIDDDRSNDDPVYGLDFTRGVTDLDPATGTSDGPQTYESLRVDFDNDGETDTVRWTSGTSHYFSGDYFALVPDEPGAARDAALAQLGETGVEDYLAALRKAGIVVFSGSATAYISGPDGPYPQAERYVHFRPVRHAGETLLWAWPENDALPPAALLYRPQPGGRLATICTFESVP